MCAISRWKSRVWENDCLRTDVCRCVVSEAKHEIKRVGFKFQWIIVKKLERKIDFNQQPKKIISKVEIESKKAEAAVARARLHTGQTHTPQQPSRTFIGDTFYQFGNRQIIVSFVFYLFVHLHLLLCFGDLFIVDSVATSCGKNPQRILMCSRKNILLGRYAWIDLLTLSVRLCFARLENSWANKKTHGLWRWTENNCRNLAKKKSTRRENITFGCGDWCVDQQLTRFCANKYPKPLPHHECAFVTVNHSM